MYNGSDTYNVRSYIHSQLISSSYMLIQTSYIACIIEIAKGVSNQRNGIQSGIVEYNDGMDKLYIVAIY